MALISNDITEPQRAGLIKLRSLDVVPQGPYCFSTPVAMPEIPNTDFMFGVGNVPEDAGQLLAPLALGLPTTPSRPRNKYED
jgi:hypothetical protein